MALRELTTAWRPLNRLDSRLVAAFVASLLVHVMLYGTYKGGQWLGLWKSLHWSPKPEAKEQTLIFEEEPKPQQPLLFVDVHPASASDEAPPDTPFYSDKNSQAANPLTDRESDVPDFAGSQDTMVRTHDAEPSRAMPLQPSFPKPTPPAEPEPEPEPKPEESAQPKGDIILAKAEDVAPQAKPKPPESQPRPRTLKEALARLPKEQADALAGRMMKQKGGVRRLEMLSSLDVRASPFGEYDRNLILAVQNRWYDLLNRLGFGYEQSGRVVVEFKLHFNGRITGIKVVENTVDSEMLSLLCQRAIDDPAPYAHWPSDMRRMVGADYREVKFTFYYN